MHCVVLEQKEEDKGEKIAQMSTTYLLKSRIWAKVTSIQGMFSWNCLWGSQLMLSHWHLDMQCVECIKLIWRFFLETHSFLHFPSPIESKGSHFYGGKSSGRALYSFFQVSRIEVWEPSKHCTGRPFVFFSFFILSHSLSLCLSDSLSTLLPLFLSDFGPCVLDSLLLFVVARLSIRIGSAQQWCLGSLVVPARNGWVHSIQIEKK